MKKRNTKTIYPNKISGCLKNEDYEKLLKICDEQQYTISQVLRLAIIKFLKNYKNEE